MTSLRLASGNMQHGRPDHCQAILDASGFPHQPRRLPTTWFVDKVRRLRSDVLLVQEVLETHLDEMSWRLGMPHWFFSAMHPRHRLGLAIFSAYPLEQTSEIVYGSFDGSSDMQTIFQKATVRVGADEYHLGNTHYCWAPDGEYSDLQRQTLPRLIQAIGSGPIIWGGDQNMPRDTSPGWSELARHWTDNIPAYYTNSLDPVFHPAVAQGKKLMVDGLFSSARYLLTNVELHERVSDHLLVSGVASCF